jgi:hypothetical protein
MPTQRNMPNRPFATKFCDRGSEQNGKQSVRKLPLALERNVDAIPRAGIHLHAVEEMHALRHLEQIAASRQLLESELPVLIGGGDANREPRLLWRRQFNLEVLDASLRCRIEDTPGKMWRERDDTTRERGEFN